MKKLYFSFLATVTLLSASAQLTQANHAPSVSYTYQTYQCDSLGINPGAAGANANWNFSTITTHSSALKSYVSVACTDPSYPSAAVAVGSATNNTFYYNSTTSNLSYYGGNISVTGGGTPVSATLYYTTPAIYAAYPMSLNTTTLSTISGSANITSPLTLPGTFGGNCSVLVDGSGTITLPGTNNTFTNALRVVTSQTINLTTSLSTATINQVTYDYYSVGIKNPIFSISTSTSVAIGTTNTQTIVTRDKNAVPSTTTTPPPTTFVTVYENAPLVINLNVFPNPSNSEVNFVTESPDAKNVLIYDITGKLIDKQIISEKRLKLSVSDYNAGLYIYSVTNKNNQTLKTGKLTVNH